MDFINIAKQRHSVRSYTNQKVEPEKLEQILEAAHVAPTAANLQPVHYLLAVLLVQVCCPSYPDRKLLLSCSRFSSICLA